MSIQLDVHLDTSQILKHHLRCFTYDVCSQTIGEKTFTNDCLLVTTCLDLKLQVSFAHARYVVFTLGDILHHTCVTTTALVVTMILVTLVIHEIEKARTFDVHFLRKSNVRVQVIGLIFMLLTRYYVLDNLCMLFEYHE